MNKFFVYMAIILVVVITIVLVCAAITGISAAKERDAIWNNGIHNDCGGEWQFVGIQHEWRYSSSIVYQCDNCGYLFNTPNVYNKEVNK